MTTRAQALGAMTAAIAFIGLLVVVQLWLVSAALDALLAGDRAVLFPAAGASLGLFAVSLAVLRYATALDRSASR